MSDKPYELVVGFETHLELATVTKMFCGCSARTFGAPPNTHVCPVCLGLPGALPVTNRRAIELGIAVGLALHCEVPEATKFDRKNYMYPDLPKGYQISQYDLPLNVNGHVDIETSGGKKRVRIRRVHVEEDTGRLLHTPGASLVDFNRSGVPLMEIVTEPDMRSVEEALAYAHALRQILIYTGASEARMEEGAIRFEPNISIRFEQDGKTVWPPQSEIKNLNSFRAIERAIPYEAERLWTEWREGGEIRTRTGKITVGWDDANERTYLQRTKEAEQDYRYFPEPDIPFLAPRRDLVEEVRGTLREMPEERRARFVREYALAPKDAATLTESPLVADYFERSARESKGDGKVAANYVLRDVLKLVKEGVVDPERLRAPEWSLAPVLDAVASNTMSSSQASAAIQAAFRENVAVARIVERPEFKQLSDASAIARAVDDAIRGNPQAVAAYKSGKPKALEALFGAVMKQTHRQADPALVRKLLQERLA